MEDCWDSRRRSPGGVHNVWVLPQDERKAVQKRTYTRWMNMFLQRRDPPIEVDDLFTDIQDGRILMALLEELSGCKILYRFRSSSHRIFRLNNISKALAFLDDRHVKLLGIDASGIADGTPSVVLNLVWNIILHFQVKEVTGGLQRHLSTSLSSLSGSSYPFYSDLSAQPDDIGSFSCNTLPSKGRKAAREPKYHGRAIKMLLQWVQRCTSQYGMDVHDFGKSWRSGLAFLALIKSINPQLVDIRESLSREPKENLQQAFKIAHHCLDIPPLLEPEDVMKTWPDEQSIITYVSMFLSCHSGLDEDHTTDTEVPEIPNFGSFDSISFGETLADDPEAQALLKGLGKSSEQQLWNRWSRKYSGSESTTCLHRNRVVNSSLSSRTSGQSSGGQLKGKGSPIQFNKMKGTNRKVLQPPSPLETHVVNQEIRLWMETEPNHVHSWRREDKHHCSLSSEEGIYSLSALESDEEDAYSYILDLNKEVFHPRNQLKRKVPRVEEETAEEMNEQSIHVEPRKRFNDSRWDGSSTCDIIKSRSAVHRKLEETKSTLKETAKDRAVSDLEPESGSGGNEERAEESVDGGQINEAGEEKREKKMGNARLVKCGIGKTDNDAVEAISEAASCQENVSERGEIENSEKCAQMIERRVDKRKKSTRCDDGTAKNNTQEESGRRGTAMKMDLPINSKEEKKREMFSTQFNIIGRRNHLTSTDHERGTTQTRDDDRAVSIPDHDNKWTPACSGISQSSREEGASLWTFMALCDITPLELEMLLFLWILLYCCLLLPQINL
ncbi:uncharacterized protein clmnb [Pholidichthys leucotaenia]